MSILTLKRRHVDEAMLKQVRKLPCMACADSDPDGARAAVFDADCKSHPHHVKTKGSGGGDWPHNLMPLCRKHHREVHRSLQSFARKYVTVRNWLDLAGWRFNGAKWHWNEDEAE